MYLRGFFFFRVFFFFYTDFLFFFFFFFQAEDGIRDRDVTGVQTCALPIFRGGARLGARSSALAPGDRGDDARPLVHRHSQRVGCRHLHCRATAAARLKKVGGGRIPPQIGRASCRERV